MACRLNQYSQPIGDAIPEWKDFPLPNMATFVGQYCQLELLNIKSHSESLFTSYISSGHSGDWTYLPFEHPDNYQIFCEYLMKLINTHGQWHYAVIDKSTNQALGTLALMRADDKNGVIEVGYVNYSPLLQKTRMATEAHFILMNYIFETLGYRRYEWKCDALNQRSKKSANRLGFQYEGTFRQAVIYKSRSRDTAWFSIIDKEWSALKIRFEKWLNPKNFDTDKKQLNKF